MSVKWCGSNSQCHSQTQNHSSFNTNTHIQLTMDCCACARYFNIRKIHWITFAEAKQMMNQLKIINDCLFDSFVLWIKLRASRSLKRRNSTIFYVIFCFVLRFNRCFALNMHPQFDVWNNEWLISNALNYYIDDFKKEKKCQYHRLVTDIFDG